MLTDVGSIACSFPGCRTLIGLIALFALESCAGEVDQASNQGGGSVHIDAGIVNGNLRNAAIPDDAGQAVSNPDERRDPSDALNRDNALGNAVPDGTSAPDGQDRGYPQPDGSDGSSSPCSPDCDGKACGDDGCGGLCGTCASGSNCDDSQQCVKTCSFSVTMNSYDGEEQWGTITFKNNGPARAAEYSVEFDVPSGTHCTDDTIPSGAKLSPLTSSDGSSHTSSNHCKFSWTDAITLNAGELKTFHYSTDGFENFDAKASTAVSDLRCAP